jgi:hypothetical protein
MVKDNKANGKKKFVSRREFLVAGSAAIAAGALSACTSKKIIETINTNTGTMSSTTTTSVAATTKTSPGVVTTTAPATTTSTITPVSASGIVKLPTGSSLSISNLKVLGCLDETSIGNDGNFKVQEPGSGIAAVSLTDAQGNMLLAGYVDAGNPNGEISAQTTAVWLLFKAFAILLPSPALWGDFIKMLSATDEAKQLAKVISEQVAVNPTALADGNEKIIAAITGAVTSLRGPDRLSNTMSSTAGQMFGATMGKSKIVRMANETVIQGPAKLIVEGGEKSGAVVTADTSQSARPEVNGFAITNTRRRHLWYYVFELGYEDEYGLYHPIDPEKVAPRDPSVSQLSYCPAVSGYSGVIGTISDVIMQDMALTAETSLPVELYMDPRNAAKTKYTVVVLGAGVIKDFRSFQDFLPDEVKSKYQTEIFVTYVLISAMTMMCEMVLPILFDFLPNGLLQEAIDKTLTPSNIVLPMLKLTEEQIEAAHKAGYGWFTNLGNWDIKGAANAFIKMIVDNEASRKTFVESIIKWLLRPPTQHPQQLPNPALDGALKTAGKWLLVLKIFDTLLATIDLATVKSHIDKSNPADYWYVTAFPAVVRLDPNSTSLLPDKTVALKASAPNIEGVIMWRFSCTNKSGHLRKWDNTDQTAEFDSSKPDITYITNKDAVGGTVDTVTVKAYLKQEGNLEYLGEATARVEIIGIAYIDRLTVTVIPEGTTRLKIDLMKVLPSSWVPLFTRDLTITPGQTEVIIRDFGNTPFPSGQYELWTSGYVNKGWPNPLTMWMEPNSPPRTPMVVKLNTGQNTILANLSQPTYLLTGGPDPLAPISFKGGGPGFLFIDFKGIRLGRGIFEDWYWFTGKPGDSGEIQVLVSNPSKYEDSETIILGPIWLHSWVDGTKIKITDGGDFSGTFAAGFNKAIYNQKFIIPEPKVPAPTTTSTSTNSSTTTSTTSTTSTSTPTSTLTTSSTTTSTPTSTSTTTNTPTFTSTTSSSTSTTSSTPTSTTTTSTSTKPPVKLPLTQVTIWLTTTNDSGASHIESIKAGTADRLYFWAQAPSNQEGDFILQATMQGGSNVQIGSSKHASAGQIVSFGYLAGDYLKTVGKVTVNALSGGIVVGTVVLNVYQ